MPDVTLNPKTFTDLYAATGISVGTKVLIQNKTRAGVNVFDDAVEPTNPVGGTIIPPVVQAQNKSGDPGAWAYSRVGGVIHVSEA